MQMRTVMLSLVAGAGLVACSTAPHPAAPVRFQGSFPVEYTGEVGPGPASATATPDRTAEELEHEVQAVEPGDPLAHVETSLFVLEEEMAREWFGVTEGGAEAHLMDRAAAGQWLRTLKGHRKVDFLNCPSLVVALGQSAEIESRHSVSYLSGYHLQANQKSRIADPVVSVVEAGLGVEVKPSAHAQADRTQLDVTLSRVDLVDPMPLVSSPLPGCGTSGELQIPVILRQRLATHADVGEAQTLLLTGLAGPEPGKTVIAFVNVRRVVAEAPAAKSAGG